VETVSDIAEEAEYMLVSHNFAPERANQTYFKISVILLIISCKNEKLKHTISTDTASSWHNADATRTHYATNKHIEDASLDGINL